MPELSQPLAVALDAAVLMAALVFLQEVVRRSWRAGRSGLRYGEDVYTGLRGWAARRRPVTWLQERYPKLAAFAAERFRADEFTGLPLTLIVVALVYLVMLAGGLVEELFEGNELLALDTRLFALIKPFRSDAVLTISAFITHFGDTTTIIAIALVVTAMLWAHGPQRFILPFWVAVIGAQTTTWLGKYVIDRSRPDFAANVPANPSFPSGHTTSAVSTYLLLAYILVRDMAPGDRKVLTVYWLAVIAGLIALSRIVLGVHYASDVAAGVLVGGFWVAVAVTAAELMKKRVSHAARDENESEPKNASRGSA